MEPKSRAQHQSRARQPFQSLFRCSPLSSSGPLRPALRRPPGLGSHWAPTAHAIAGLLPPYSAPPLGAGSALSPPETARTPQRWPLPPLHSCGISMQFNKHLQSPHRHRSPHWALWTLRNPSLTLPWRHSGQCGTQAPLQEQGGGGADSWKQTHGKVLDLTSHQGNANQNHMRCHFGPTRVTGIRDG